MLHNDVLEFCEYNNSKLKEHKRVVDLLVSFIREIVKNIFYNEFDVHIFGSHSTDLSLTWSDIDLCLVNKLRSNSNNNNYTTTSILRTLNNKLQDEPWLMNCLLIENTTIPILKIEANDNYLNYHIDISVQDSKHFGLKCVDLVRLYLKEYEVLQPLTITLKNILKSADLNDPYKGGLSSYGLILLIISFLQNKKNEKNNIHINDDNLGKLLIDFLAYYSTIFDPSSYIVQTYLPNTNNLDPIQVIKYILF